MTALSTRRLDAVLLVILLAAITAPAAVHAETLPEWKQLTPAQRDALIAPIRERWNAEPAQRPRMLAHAERWSAMPPEQRRRARQGMQRWQQMAPDQRARMRAVFAHLRPLPEAERKAFMARWRSMSDAEKQAWVQANPAPERLQRER